MRCRSAFFGLMLTALLGVAAAPSASAVALLDITGAADGFQGIDPGQAVGSSFSLSQNFTDVAISADFTCPACAGFIFLTKHDFGPTSSAADLVAVAPFGPGTGNPILSGLALLADDYFLIIAINGDSVGGAAWFTSSSALTTLALGTTYNFDFRADTIDITLPSTSDFVLITAPGRLLYSVSGTPLQDEPTEVAEPPLLSLVMLGAIAVGWRRRHGQPTDG